MRTQLFQVDAFTTRCFAGNPAAVMPLAALEQRRDKTRMLKQAMMQELLTGRTRLV
jgi:predicted PhzF superfamily epimerase YddE/YHI9